MNDQKDQGRYKMALDRIDDEIEENEFGIDPSDDFIEDDGFDAQSAHEEWDARGTSDGFFKRYGVLLGCLIVGAALIWLLFSWIGTTREIAGISGTSDMEVQVLELQNRIAQLEQRPLSETNLNSATSGVPETEPANMVTKDDFQRLAKRIDRLESMVNNLRTQKTSTPAKKPVTVAAKKKTTSPKKATAAKKTVKAPTIHIVIKGDTLYDIARRNKVSVDQLKKWNGLTSNNLKLGQKLKIEP